MTKKEKAVDQYIRDKHSTDECSAYIQGWKDANKYHSGNANFNLAVGMLIGATIIIVISLILTLKP
jgi:hypothetical protein